MSERRAHGGTGRVDRSQPTPPRPWRMTSRATTPTKRQRRPIKGVRILGARADSRGERARALELGMNWRRARRRDSVEQRRARSASRTRGRAVGQRGSGTCRKSPPMRRPSAKCRRCRTGPNRRPARCPRSSPTTPASTADDDLDAWAPISGSPAAFPGRRLRLGRGRLRRRPERTSTRSSARSPKPARSTRKPSSPRRSRQRRRRVRSTAVARRRRDPARARDCTERRARPARAATRVDPPAPARRATSRPRS